MKQKQPILLTLGICFTTLSVAQLLWVWDQAYADVPLTSPITAPVTVTPTDTPAATHTPAPTNTPVPTVVPTATPTQTPSFAMQPTVNPTTAPKPVESQPSKHEPEKPKTVTTEAAIASAPGEVTLRWKTVDTATGYSITYGTTPEANQYGVPFIGRRETTSYTIGSLTMGEVYYFKIRALAEYKPGDFSHTVSVRVTGKSIDGNTVVFTTLGGNAEVFSVEPQQEVKAAVKTKTVSPKAAATVKQQPGFFGRIMHFFQSFFLGKKA